MMIRASNETAHAVHDLIRRRRSPRAFAEQPVEPEKLHGILEAARWAPSANNEQPWRFVVAAKDDAEAYAALLSTLNERNRRWAEQAPVLILTAAQTTYSQTGMPNRYALYDLGMAVGTMLVQVTALGLYAHQMGGFDAERARAVVGLPEGYEPVAMMALGYLGDAERLPEDLRERERAPRTRKPLEELAFAGRWGHQQLAA